MRAHTQRHCRPLPSLIRPLDNQGNPQTQLRGGCARAQGPRRCSVPSTLPARPPSLCILHLGLRMLDPKNRLVSHLQATTLNGIGLHSLTPLVQCLLHLHRPLDTDPACSQGNSLRICYIIPYVTRLVTNVFMGSGRQISACIAAVKRCWGGHNGGRWLPPVQDELPVSRACKSDRGWLLNQARCCPKSRVSIAAGQASPHAGRPGVEPLLQLQSRQALP